MSGMKILVTALMIGSAAAGCGRSAGMAAESAQPVSAAATIAVKNDYMLSLDVYLVSSGHATRIGNVGPGMSSTFTVDPAMVPSGQVEVVAQPPGGGAVARTGNLPLRGGDVIDFEIANNPRFSTTRIR